MIILRQIKIQQLNIAKVLITNCQFYTTKKIENLKSKTPKKLEFENIKIDKSILTTFKLIDSVSPLSSKPKKKSTSKEKGKEKEKFSFGGKKVTVYTDGACSSNGNDDASAGIGIYWGDTHPLNISRKLPGKQTNNRAEITAAIVAIEQALTYNAGELTICTDSMFMINCVTKWIRNWKRNGWLLSDGGPVKNKKDLEKLDELCIKMKVKWKYVAGHSGQEGNEEADRLARLAIS